MKFWRNISSPTKVRKYTPDNLWANFCEYMDKLDDNPLHEVQFHGKNAEECLVPKPRMATKQGFMNHSGLSEKQIDDMISDSHYAPVFERIHSVILEYNLMYGAANLMNPYLVSAVHGISRKVDIKKEETTKVVLYTPSNNREISTQPVNSLPQSATLHLSGINPPKEDDFDYLSDDEVDELFGSD